MCADVYHTVDASAEAVYTEKRSKFLAFVRPVTTEDDVKTALSAFQHEYYDARHVCYAYVLGPDGARFRANDNGEPSGTAGKPILGQIHSKGLTNVLVVVVRYFGGIKLGTSGLTAAYRTAAREALDAAPVVERTVDGQLVAVVPYTGLNAAMRVVKELSPVVVEQGYSGMDCRLVLRIRLSVIPQLKERLGKIEFLRIEDETTV